MFPFHKRLLLRLVSSTSKNVKCVRSYSRNSDSKNLGYFKVVNSNEVVEGGNDGRLEASPNWELFGARGQRFLLPGSIGPAWHESGSMVPVDGFNAPYQLGFETLECTAQDCPVLLKDAIRELFPGIDSSGSLQLTVVTLSRKKFGVAKKGNDNEHNAKTFMWAAQEICLRLKMAGYWADFINPFSGRPYLSPFQKPTLYEADERFRCLGFEIRKEGGTKIIAPTKGSNFVGSLFTNAPPSTDFLLDVLTKNELSD